MDEELSQMQSPGQEPTEEIGRENGGVGNEEPSIQQGFVYPPPPSYYQNMQLPAVRPPLPAPPGAHTSPALDSLAAETRARFYPPGVQIPPYSRQRFPGGQPRARRSYKWVWVVASIFTVAALASCGLFGWAFYQLFNTALQQESGATDVVNNYFQQVQHQSYANAYQFLQISNLTQDDYIARAQASDTQNGSVRSFVVEQPTFGSNSSSGPDFTRWNVTVDVTRTKTSYPVLVMVQKAGGGWKITYIDRY